MIEIINQQSKYWINKNKFKLLLEKLVKYYDLPNPEVTLAFVTNRIIRDLNRKFLEKDAPTDVLSFPVREKEADGKYYLGDIIISAHKAFQQCFSETHGLERELEYLTIHGFLHLQGFEHSQGLEEEEKKIRKIMLAGENGN